MEEFPFAATEWTAISEAALPLVNATFAGDRVLRSSHLERLLDVLSELREVYGDHPKLLETEADFIDDKSERKQLYLKAIRIAVANRLSTLSIRLSLARLLLEMGETRAAHVELLACQLELSGGDEQEKEDWTELLTQCRETDRA